MKSISILTAIQHVNNSTQINLHHPYSTTKIEKILGSASFFAKKAVQYREKFPLNSFISKDWSKLLLLSCLGKPIHCAVFVGNTRTNTHLLFISPQSYNRAERAALLLAASNNIHVKLTGITLPFSKVEEILNEWKYEFNIKTTAGMVINDSGIYRCGEWPKNEDFLQKWFIK